MDSSDLNFVLGNFRISSQNLNIKVKVDFAKQIFPSQYISTKDKKHILRNSFSNNEEDMDIGASLFKEYKETQSIEYQYQIKVPRFYEKIIFVIDLNWTILQDFIMYETFNEESKEKESKMI